MLEEKYKKEVIPEMKKMFEYDNSMAVPKIEKVVVNTGVGRLLQNTDPSRREAVIKDILENLTMICAQKPVVTESKKAIAGFKVRKGSTSGIKITLRGKRMYDFLDRLIHLSLPRTRDFQGININAIDKGGNLTIGIKEHIIFPEIQPEKIKNNIGMEINIVTNSKNKEEAAHLFKLLGFPLREDKKEE
jgi:large subunit ribosomal protein L5